jgi:hypothetical protein
MSLLCLIGKHTWGGCKCNQCGKNREIDHKWMEENCNICRVCKKVRRDGHDWDGCKCRRCSTSRDVGHDWDGCKCQRCGAVQEKGHALAGTTCTKCGTVNPPDPDFDDLDLSFKQVDEVMLISKMPITPGNFERNCALQKLTALLNQTVFSRREIDLMQVDVSRMQGAIFLHARQTRYPGYNDEFAYKIYRVGLSEYWYCGGMIFHDASPSYKAENLEKIKRAQPDKEPSQKSGALSQPIPGSRPLPEKNTAVAPASASRTHATLVITYSIEKLGGGAYGFAAWTHFWELIKPVELTINSRLFCGDVLRENSIDYVIAIVGLPDTLLEALASRLAFSSSYRSVAGADGVAKSPTQPSGLLLAGVITAAHCYENRESNWADLALERIIHQKTLLENIDAYLEAQNIVISRVLDEGGDEINDHRFHNARAILSAEGDGQLVITASLIGAKPTPDLSKIMTEDDFNRYYATQVIVDRNTHYIIEYMNSGTHFTVNAPCLGISNGEYRFYIPYGTRPERQG